MVRSAIPFSLRLYSGGAERDFYTKRYDVLIVAIGICLISVLLVDEHAVRAVNIDLATQLASDEPWCNSVAILIALRGMCQDAAAVADQACGGASVMACVYYLRVVVTSSTSKVRSSGEAGLVMNRLSPLSLAPGRVVEVVVWPPSSGRERSQRVTPACPENPWWQCLRAFIGGELAREVTDHTCGQDV